MIEPRFRGKKNSRGRVKIKCMINRMVRFTRMVSMRKDAIEKSDKLALLISYTVGNQQNVNLQQCCEHKHLAPLCKKQL